MATIGTITQLPKDFFSSAATLAGDGNQKLALTEQTDAGTNDQEAEAAADITPDRQAHTQFTDSTMARSVSQSWYVCSSVESQTGESGPTCVTCGIGMCANDTPCIKFWTACPNGCFSSGVSSPAFESQTEQRLHFKGDWHRFNVKLRSVGKAAVDEAEFERLVSEKDEVGASFL